MAEAQPKSAAVVVESQSAPSFKRLVICCDGTWLDSSGTLDDGIIDPPSNITRLTRAITSRSRDGIQQIVYYQAGVGSTGGIINKVAGGGTGAGLAENVREAYVFLCNNYSEGDEIFLIGFSRGAFTARSVAGLMGAIGLLTRQGLPFFPVIYLDWSHRQSKSYRSPQPNLPYPNKPSADSPAYAKGLAKRRLTTLHIRIRAICVFDTVGSLGIPEVGFLGPVAAKLQMGHSNQYAFYDTTLDESVDNAFQALALDERRTAFAPCLWELRNNRRTNLIQVWMPGVHCNVGGSYNDQELANISMAWMLSMLEPLLDFNRDYVTVQEVENEEYYEDTGKRQRPWSFGKLYNSVTAVYALGGTTIRTPGNYTRTDPVNGEPTNIPLRNTNEYIHASVRTRYVLRGPGYAEKGEYDPPALSGWRLRSNRSGATGVPAWFWEEEGHKHKVLPEAPLRSIEKQLLRAVPRTDPDVRQYLHDTKQPSKKSKHG